MKPTALEVAAVFVAACSIRVALGGATHATMLMAGCCAVLLYVALHEMGVL